MKHNSKATHAVELYPVEIMMWITFSDNFIWNVCTTIFIYLFSGKFYRTDDTRFLTVVSNQI